MITADSTLIEQAISALKAHRELIGDAVADTTIATLQEQLAELQGGPGTDPHRISAQRKQITTMFANINGLAGVIASLHEIDLLDLTQALWHRMDRAIIEQGGTIDKHVVDGVMGLFGVPVAREDAPERAIRAALAMRAVLADFTNEMRVFDGPNPFRDLQLRIGINTGPVLLGKVGTGEEYSVIGTAVNLASRLEQIAPAGGILISHDTHLLVQDIFNVESLAPIEIRGIGEPVPIYLVLGLKPRSFHRSAWGVQGILTRMVGRDKELRQLQNALQTALQTGQGRAIQVTGEAGVGKSRLLYELSRWISSLPEKVITFKGRADQQASQMPYSLIRNLLATQFGIQDTDQTAVVEEKLTSGMHAYMELNDQELRNRAQAIGQLIGLSVASETQSLVARVEAPQMRARAFDYLREFFETVATNYAVLMIVLEDTHWADAYSRDLVNHLAESCLTTPLLLISITRPLAADGRPNQTHTAPLLSSQSSPLAIELPLLSATESRQLVLEVLRKVPACPEELCQLIVSRTDGNPFYVEELIKVFIEDGVIITGEEEWQVLPNRFSTVRVPPTLTGVLQARLDRLTAVERVTLQRAAVVGRMFWDSAVIHIGEMANNPLGAAETRVALNALTKRELIFQRSASGFANTEAYAFKHAFLHDVTYESVLLRERPLYHKLAADWLAERSGDRIAEYAQLIGEHYEHAGEQVAAAELYEIAGGRAQAMYSPEAAIGYYRRALALLQNEPLEASLRAFLYQQLGPLLRMQARLVEAGQAYVSMQRIAEQDGDLVAQARASNGLAAISRDQAAHNEMRQYADQAQQVAWLVNEDEQLVQALQFVGEANHRLGQHIAGLSAAEQALELSRRSDLVDEISSSLKLLCTIHIETGNDAEASRYLELLEQQGLHLEASSESQMQLAANRAAVGQLYSKLGLYVPANYLALQALETYRKGDHQQEIAQALCDVADIACWRNDPETARPLYQEAVSIAMAIGDEYGALFYRARLGAAWNSSGQYDEAGQLLSEVLQTASDPTRFADWIGLPNASMHLAEAYLGQGKTADALALARQAHEQARRQMKPVLIGMTWCTLGKVTSRLSPREPSILVDDSVAEASDCFAASMRLLRQVDGDRHRVYQAQVRTLLAWAAHEQDSGNQTRASQLQDEAESLMERLALSAEEERRYLKEVAGD